MESTKPILRTTWDSGRKSSAGGIRYDRNIAVDSVRLPKKRIRARP